MKDQNTWLNLARSHRIALQQQSGSGSKKDVIELTDDNFDKMVLDSDDVWMVEFFAPWCGHCKKWVWYRSTPSHPPSLRGNWPTLLYNRGLWKFGWKGAQQVLLIRFFVRVVVSLLWPLRSSVVNSLEPEWAAAATAVKEQTKGRVRLGAVDATVHQAVSSRYGVRKDRNVWAKTEKNSCDAVQTPPTQPHCILIVTGWLTFLSRFLPNIYI